MAELLDKLIQRGDKLSFTDGSLSIIAASGQTIPKDWVLINHDKLLKRYKELEAAIRKQPKDQTVDEWIYAYCKDTP